MLYLTLTLHLHLHFHRSIENFSACTILRAALFSAASPADKLCVFARLARWQLFLLVLHSTSGCCLYHAIENRANQNTGKPVYTERCFDICPRTMSVLRSEDIRFEKRTVFQGQIPEYIFAPNVGYCVYYPRNSPRIFDHFHVTSSLSKIQNWSKLMSHQSFYLHQA